jgi:transcriptional regulator with XRE-family HTH domain
VSAFGNRQRLAEELKRLRVLSGISGRELGRRIGLDQSTISRIERGEQQRVSVAQVVAWSKATEAPEERQAELLALAENILVGPTSWEAASETGSTDFGQETAELEARTGLLSNYQPAAIPGLLQTSAYARRLLSSGPEGVPGDLADRVMNRVDRQHVLYDEGKRFRFVIPEAVLRWPYGPAGDPAVLDEHREQLARVEWATGRPNVEVGILPLGPVAVWRTAGFVIFDEVEDGDAQVHLEWLTRPYNIFEPGQVETCRQAFSNLLSASVEGSQARQLITSAASSLRERQGSLDRRAART